MADAAAASALLPVLIDEIRRLKDMHALAAGVTELPVKDAVVREELAKLRSEFAQISSFFGGARSSKQAPTTEASAREDKDEAKGSAFGQAAKPAETHQPPARPRMNSVNVSTMLSLPAGCDTHFFLVSTN